jgi:hypothetical protein
LKRRLNTVRFWESIADVVPKRKLFLRRFTEGFDDTPDVRDGLGRGAHERDQAFPRILPDQPHASIFLNCAVNGRIPVNLLQQRI